MSSTLKSCGFLPMTSRLSSHLDAGSVQTQARYSYTLDASTRVNTLKGALTWGRSWGPDAILFKFNVNEFSVAPSRGALLHAMEEYVNTHGVLPPMYEVVRGKWVRFYMDIDYTLECAMTEDEQDALRSKIVAFVIKKLKCLVAGEDHDVRLIVCSNHRPLKFSLHIIAPDISFDDHTTTMRLFVAHVKDDAPIELRPMIDLNVYHKNQAFRFVYSPKQFGGPPLLPPQLSTNLITVAEWMERCMLSGAVPVLNIYNWHLSRLNIDLSSLSSASSHGVNSSVNKKMKMLPIVDPESKDEMPLSLSDDEDRVIDCQGSEKLDKEDECTTVQQRIVLLILPHLKRDRWVNYSKWMMMGFGLASIFHNNKVYGYSIFLEHSRQSPNFAEVACKNLYDNGNMNINMKQFMLWLEEDTTAEVVTNVRMEIRKLQSDAHSTALSTSVKLDSSVIRAWVTEFNEDAISRAELHALTVEYLNKFIIYVSSSVTGTYIDLANPDQFVIRPRKGLIDAYEHLSFTIVDPSKKKPTAQEFCVILSWLKSPHRRMVTDIVFEPWVELPDKRKHIYNLFQGLAIPYLLSIEGDVTPFTDHIFNVWAGKDPKITTYILSWFAHLIQRPGVKMGTVIVLRGEPGAGKGVIMDFISKILGREHYIQIFNMDHLTGSFQSPKERTNLLCFMDESCFAGNRKEAAQFKGLITEKERRFNEKHLPAHFIENCSNYVVASNQEQMVYVEPKDRRFLCVECSNEYSGNQTDPKIEEYHRKLRAVDVRSIAHFLYTFPIDDWNQRNMPTSTYQKYQKTINLDSPGMFISRMLETCYIQVQDPVTKAWLQVDLRRTKTTEVLKKDLYDAYKVMSFGNFRERVVVERFFRSLYTYLNVTSDICKLRRTHNGPRRFIYLPSVVEMRKSFAERMGDVDWFTEIERDEVQHDNEEFIEDRNRV